MADPFQDLGDSGASLIDLVIDVLEARSADPGIAGIIEAFLDDVDWSEVRRAVDIGTGTGPIARAIAARAPDAEVIGLDPAPALIAHAQKTASGSNLRFEIGMGRATGLPSASIDLVTMHAVLSHVVAPEDLLEEAYRILRPGGTLVLCDADFFGVGPARQAGHDPLSACANYFVDAFVTHPNITARLQPLAVDAGFRVEDFRMTPRRSATEAGVIAWIVLAAHKMEADGVIGLDLAEALIAEEKRRTGAAKLYGYRSFATLVATRV